MLDQNFPTRKREAILGAMQLIKSVGFPPEKRSGKRAKYCLVSPDDGRHYLPRAVVLWAYMIDDSIDAPNRSRDSETNAWLKDLDFEVIDCYYKPQCHGEGWNPREYRDIDPDAPMSRKNNDSFPDYGSGESIIEDVLPDDWRGKVNVIPGRKSGRCYRTLVVGIGFNDSIDERLSQAIQHVNEDCPETALVVFLAMRWDSDLWLSRYERQFRGLEIKCVLRPPFKTAVTLI